MYAVFRSGGKQYRGSQGDRLKLEKIQAEEGASVNFDEVILVGEGKDIDIGNPYVSNVSVTAKVISQGKSKKVPVVKCETEVVLRNIQTSYEYNSDQEAEDDINNAETATQREHVTRSLKIKVAAMPPLGAGSE